MEKTFSIQEKIHIVKGKMRDAALRAGRSVEEIKRVLVTKTVPAAVVEEAFRAGVQEFGENRVQEFVEKKSQLPSTVRWHMIGHLQTNKVKQVVGEAALIHSLDRLELLQELEKQAAKKGIEKIDCLVQINSSGEASKFGMAPEEAFSFTEAVREDSPVKIRGLMTIGPLTEEAAKIREAFQTMKRLRQDLKEKFPNKDWGILSMGMSGDYEIAIEEGATLIRVGSAVFGARA